jgi:hypothetical protein
MYLKLTPPDELKVAKTNKNAVLQQIVKDCDEAAKLLSTAIIPQAKGRATHGAAYALAAKASLYLKNYNDVVLYVSKVKALNIYGLMEDYNANFKKETQNNKESVWEIQHSNLELGVGNSLNQWLLSKKVMGYGFAEATSTLADAYEPGDPRRQFTIASNNEPYFGSVYKNSFSSTKFSPRKYIQTPSEVTQAADGDINYTAIRFAEVLLWEAEALTESNNITAASTILEVVRSRARAQAVNPITTLPTITTTNQEEMRKAIRHERQVELGFEMHRFFDLVRWGIAADMLPGFVKGKHEVFPIPQTEIDLNKNLEQNVGY